MLKSSKQLLAAPLSLIAAALATTAALQPPPLAAQELGGCPMYPRNNIWNVPVDKLPVHANSAKFIETGGIQRNLHPDFSKTGGIPYIIVPANQPMVPITLASGESDPGPYPIPDNLPIEAGAGPDSDNHGIILQQGTCKLYEIYQATKNPDGTWKGSSGAVFDLKANGLRPDGWTSADAAGFAILPGLIRWDEIQAGEIKHAIRLTIPKTRNEYVWPARHFASRLWEPIYPPMGTRFRLKANYDISGFPKEVQVVLRAIKKYGMLLADNGQSWFLTGSPDSHWDDEIWTTIKRVKGSDLEAVDTSSLMISPNSAQAGTVATIAKSEVPFSASPVFDLQVGSTHMIRLTGNVTAPVFTGLLDGQNVSFLICQDDTGGRQFTWPSNVLGGMKVGLAPRACLAQQFIVNGNLLQASAPGVITIPPAAAAAAPAAAAPAAPTPPPAAAPVK